MNKTINCPTCKKEIIDVDHFLGLCDECLGIDDKSWEERLEDGILFNDPMVEEMDDDSGEDEEDLE